MQKYYSLKGVDVDKNTKLIRRIVASEGATIIDQYNGSKHRVFVIRLRNGEIIRQIVSHGSGEMYKLYRRHIRSDIRRATALDQQRATPAMQNCTVQLEAR